MFSNSKSSTQPVRTTDLETDKCTPVEITSNCPCDIIIDSKGIRSDNIGDAKWNGNKLTFNCNGSSSSYSYSSSTTSSSSSVKIVSIDNRVRNSVTIINGRVIANDTETLPEIEKKKLDEPWPMRNPVIEKINANGSGNYDVSVPLNTNCQIAVTGSSSVNVIGDNPNSTLYATISGAGSIKGSGSIKILHARVTGVGEILGFHVMSKFFGTVSGIGNINVNKAEDCFVQKKKVTGLGKINFNYEPSRFKRLMKMFF